MDPENTIVLTLESGPVTIKLRPDLALAMSSASRNWPAKASMTAWSSTA